MIGWATAHEGAIKQQVDASMLGRLKASGCACIMRGPAVELLLVRGGPLSVRRAHAVQVCEEGLRWRAHQQRIPVVGRGCTPGVRGGAAPQYDDAVATITSCNSTAMFAASSPTPSLKHPPATSQSTHQSCCMQVPATGAVLAHTNSRSAAGWRSTSRQWGQYVLRRWSCFQGSMCPQCSAGCRLTWHLRARGAGHTTGAWPKWARTMPVAGRSHGACARATTPQSSKSLLAPDSTW
jgi:hypothetical protein